MLFMVIERFKDGDAAPVYQRFHAQGRMLPEGLRYVASWTTTDGTRCLVPPAGCRADGTGASVQGE